MVSFIISPMYEVWVFEGDEAKGMPVDILPFHRITAAVAYCNALPEKHFCAIKISGGGWYKWPHLPSDVEGP